MATKPDISTREDIHSLIVNFYKMVVKDDWLGEIFSYIKEEDWPKHIEVITDFWETILLDHPLYKNNAMEVHHQLNKIYRLQEKHFERWLFLFNRTLDEMYEGEKVLLAKKRADGIAKLMLFKMNNENL